MRPVRSLCCSNFAGIRGMAKTASAREALLAINPHVTVMAHDQHITAENALDIIGRYDIVADGWRRSIAVWPRCIRRPRTRSKPERKTASNS